MSVLKEYKWREAKPDLRHLIAEASQPAFELQVANGQLEKPKEAKK